MFRVLGNQQLVVPSSGTGNRPASEDQKNINHRLTKTFHNRLYIFSGSLISRSSNLFSKRAVSGIGSHSLLLINEDS